MTITNEQKQAPHILIPGSFNPLHEGHITIYNYLSSLIIVKENTSLSSSSSPSSSSFIAFELCLTNIDKASTSIASCIHRILQMLGKYNVVFTLLPLFKDKIKIVNNVQPMKKKEIVVCEVDNNKDEIVNINGVNFNLENVIIFGIGYDTYIRIIDKKYYGNSNEQMIKTLQEMLEGRKEEIVSEEVMEETRKRNVFFYVAKRINSLHPNSSDTLPLSLMSHFIPVPEDILSNDISSTTIRNRITSMEEKLKSEFGNIWDMLCNLKTKIIN
jgi:hypothetical protein